MRPCSSFATGAVGAITPTARGVGHLPTGHGHAGRQAGPHADRHVGLTGCRTGARLPDERMPVEPMTVRIDPPRAGARHRALRHADTEAAWSNARAPQIDRTGGSARHFIARQLPARPAGHIPRGSPACAAARSPHRGDDPRRARRSTRPAPRPRPALRAAARKTIPLAPQYFWRAVRCFRA